MFKLITVSEDGRVEGAFWVEAEDGDQALCAMVEEHDPFQGDNAARQAFEACA